MMRNQANFQNCLEHLSTEKMCVLPQKNYSLIGLINCQFCGLFLVLNLKFNDWRPQDQNISEECDYTEGKIKAIGVKTEVTLHLSGCNAIVMLLYFFLTSILATPGLNCNTS